MGKLKNILKKMKMKSTSSNLWVFSKGTVLGEVNSDKYIY